jgi:hypothetical protein
MDNDADDIGTLMEDGFDDYIRYVNWYGGMTIPYHTTIP